MFSNEFNKTMLLVEKKIAFIKKKRQKNAYFVCGILKL